jgi:Calcineurin-like phosphoesterase
LHLKPRRPRGLRKKSNTRNECRNSGCHFGRALVLYPHYETAPAILSPQMKSLLTADLHFRIDWFRWLIGQAPNYDLVCIAGDLLDMFDNKSTREQAREVTSLIWELADIVPVAVCSGNHDNAGGLVPHNRAPLYKWFIDLGTHPNIITDGVTRKLEDLILTTIPYHCSKEEKSIWLDRGSTIRRQTGQPWMVLHHVPPKTGLGVSGEESEAAALIGPSILFPVMTMPFLTNPAKAGSRDWATCACWCRVN